MDACPTTHAPRSNRCNFKRLANIFRPPHVADWWRQMVWNLWAGNGKCLIFNSSPGSENVRHMIVTSQVNSNQLNSSLTRYRGAWLLGHTTTIAGQFRVMLTRTQCIWSRSNKQGHGFKPQVSLGNSHILSEKFLSANSVSSVFMKKTELLILVLSQYDR